jgi:hypothetical protein
MRLRPGTLLIDLWVSAELYLRDYIPGAPSGLVGVHGLGRPQADPALFGTHAVLSDPRSLSTRAKAYPKARQQAIEDDHFRLAVSQFEGADGGFCESHG